MFSALAATVMIAAVSTALYSHAGDAPTDPSHAKADPKIHITSDSLITDNKTKFAEFIGNVRASQGSNSIVADRLKIFFEKNMKRTVNPMADQESITKIVANGNVTINFDNKVAVTEQAVYITDARVLVLTGANTTITSGSDSIAGEKITLYRADGRIKVESGAENRVNAVFFSGDKGLN